MGDNKVGTKWSFKIAPSHKLGWKQNPCLRLEPPTLVLSQCLLTESMNEVEERQSQSWEVCRSGVI